VSFNIPVAIYTPYIVLNYMEVLWVTCENPVFASTKNEFSDNMVDPKFVMHYSERLFTQFWKKAEAILHTGEKIYYFLTTPLACSTGRHP